MKKLLIIFLICISSSIKAHDITESPFYISFFKIFPISYAKPIDKQTGYFFSILMKTNKSGAIVLFEESTGADSILTKSLNEAYKKADRNGLKSYGFKGSTLLFPVFILDATNTKYNNKEFGQMWTYKSKFKTNDITSITSTCYLL